MAGSCESQAAEPVVDRSPHTEAQKPARGRPCRTVVDSYPDTSAPSMSGSASEILERPWWATVFVGRGACFRPRKRRTKYWSRRKTGQRSRQRKNQPEATNQRTTRLSADEERPVRTEDDPRRSSAAQTKLKATDCRFLGRGSGTTVGAPALRLVLSDESSTEKPSCVSN